MLARLVSIDDSMRKLASVFVTSNTHRMKAAVRLLTEEKSDDDEGDIDVQNSPPQILSKTN